MRLTLSLLSLLLASGIAASVAAEVAPPPQVLESVVVMRVDSSITLDPQGKVADLAIRTKLPEALRDTLDRTVRNWQFKPVLIAGTPRQVRADMRVTLAAEPVGQGYRITIDNVLFPGTEGVKADQAALSAPMISPGKLSPPIYPAGLNRANVKGTVLLAIRVGADGRAEQVQATQSMLYDVRGRDKVLAEAIHIFEKSALAAAKRWTFNISPERGRLSAAERTVTVPVAYLGYDGPKPEAEAAGEWRAVVRVPKRAIEWLPAEKRLQQAGVSDLAAGEMIPLASAIEFSAPVLGSQLL